MLWQMKLFMKLFFSNRIAHEAGFRRAQQNPWHTWQIILFTKLFFPDQMAPGTGLRRALQNPWQDSLQQHMEIWSNAMD